jgi:hypothetical protein
MKRIDPTRERERERERGGGRTDGLILIDFFCRVEGAKTIGALLSAQVREAVNQNFSFVQTARRRAVTCAGIAKDDA